jgi:uncharacterized membrane protein
VQFVLRFLSDLCAPGFFLWMGVGIAFLTTQRSREGWDMAAITRFLFLRGLLLIAIGQFVETPAWLIGLLAAKTTHISAPVPGGGGPIYAAIGVVFALGASMILTGLLIPLIRLHSWKWIVLGASLLMLCSALIPAASHAGDVFAWWQRLLLVTGQSGVILFEYPVLPWLAITCVGVALGQWLEQRDRGAMTRASAWISVVLIITAFALRFLGGFGNTRVPRDDSWIELLNLIKYPPSLVFSLMMLGGNLLLFSLFSAIDARKWKAGRMLATFGRAPLFFYIAHLYLFAIVGAALFQHGTNYLIGLMVWAVGLFPLYYACAWFDRFKRAHSSTSVWRML